MVVCNTPLLPLAPNSCPITPSFHSFPSAFCPLSPVSAIPCNQRYPPTSIISTGPIITASTPVPCVPGISSTPVIRCQQTSSSPQNTPLPQENCTDNAAVTNNNILTSTVVPCTTTNIIPSSMTPSTATNIVPLNSGTTTIVPYNPGINSATIVQCSPRLNYNQALPTTSVSAIQCSQAVYTCNSALPSSAVVPCTPRMVSGASVLQCTPGVCQITTPVMQPAAVFPAGAVEVCPIPSAAMVPSNTIYSVSPSLSIPQNLCTSPTVSPWKQSYGMEQVWQAEFRSLFYQYAPHTWVLLPILQKPAGAWISNVDSAKVRFCCEDCGHGWTSMKGRVAFWFILNETIGEGVVCLKLYGQQCDRCKTGNYETAMWYPEEVVKVLVNIYNRVGQVYYGFQQAPYHRARRPGKPRTPHNSDLCQACKDGVCAERR